MTEISSDLGDFAFKPLSILTSLDLKPSQPENPWVMMAGEFKDDPLFDAMLTDIADYRRSVDEGVWGRAERNPKDKTYPSDSKPEDVEQMKHKAKGFKAIPRLTTEEKRQLEEICESLLSGSSDHDVRLIAWGERFKTRLGGKKFFKEWMEEQLLDDLGVDLATKFKDAMVQALKNNLFL